MSAAERLGTHVIAAARGGAGPALPTTDGAKASCGPRIGLAFLLERSSQLSLAGPAFEWRHALALQPSLLDEALNRLNNVAGREAIGPADGEILRGSRRQYRHSKAFVILKRAGVGNPPTKGHKLRLAKRGDQRVGLSARRRCRHKGSVGMAR